LSHYVASSSAEFREPKKRSRHATHKGRQGRSMLTSLKLCHRLMSSRKFL
ncbi:hypothetical protein NDU88_004180, partial [Pleurodeles waltl]